MVIEAETNRFPARDPIKIGLNQTRVKHSGGTVREQILDPDI